MTGMARSDPAITELIMKMSEKLLADTYERTSRVVALAHYTTPAAFLSILRSEELWCSNVASMNDWSEVRSGAEIVFGVIKDRYGNGIAGIEIDLASLFQHLYSAMHDDTYVFCLSDHDPASDTPSGRLGMWRAYGLDGNGLCLVFKKAVLLDQHAIDRNFPFKWVPMIYATPEQFTHRVQDALTYVEHVVSENKALVERAQHQAFGHIMVYLLMALALGHKNLAFSDEREIRFVYTREFSPGPFPDGMEFDANVVRNILHPIIRIKLREYPEYGLRGTTLAGILDHIVIGPSPNQRVQKKGVELLLAKKT